MFIRNMIIAVLLYVFVVVAAAAPADELVLVAGATGGAGQQIVAQLQEQGYGVRALVRDAASAFVGCLEAPIDDVGDQVFNVGDDQLNRTISEIGQLIQARFPQAEMQQVTNEDDPRNYKVSFRKIREAIAFEASISLEEGIDELSGIIDRGSEFTLADPVLSNAAFLRDRGDRVAALHGHHYIMGEDESYLRQHSQLSLDEEATPTSSDKVVSRGA